MKQFLLILISLLFCCYSFGQEHPEALSKQRNLQKLRDFTPSKAGNMFDVKHYTLDLQVNPAVSAISGTITTLFEMKTESNIISFDLRDNMIIDSIKYEGLLIDAYENNNHELSITLPNPIETGVLKSIAVSYHGSPIYDGLGAFETTQHNGAPVLWTLSEPYGAYTWWPCKQTLNDKADSIDVIVTVPSGNKVGSNGVLISTTNMENNQIQYHWKHRHAIATYLIAIAVTNYTELTSEVPVEGQDPIQIVDYAYPENATSWQASQSYTNRSMTLFNNLFITYPFADEKYGHSQFSWGGGMEHQTMSFMVNLGESLVVHELAHQWFGDYITCKGWDNIWINEGFATYCEGLYSENIYGNTSFKNWRSQLVSYITSLPHGSVYCYDTTNINNIFDSRLSYYKGAMVLHMLRKQVGDEAFFQGIKNYLNDPELINGFADTDDFRRHIEQAADSSLMEFFNDWIFNQGYASYKVVWEVDDDITRIKITNTPSHNSVSFFKMKVPIRFTGTTESTTVWLHNTEENQVFELQLGFTPRYVTFDPDSELITKNNTVIKGQVSIQEDLSHISIYPNPSESGDIFIKSSKNISQIMVYTIDGKEIMIKNNPENETVIHLNQGVYILKIDFHDNTSHTETIVIK